MDSRIYDTLLFRDCNRSVVDGILERYPSRFSSYRKGDFIAMQNSVCRSLYVLCEGSVYARMISGEGREFTLDTLSAPDVLVSAFLFGTENILPAHSDCKLWIINKACVLSLIEQDRAILHNFLAVLSDHSLFLSRKLEQFALQTLSSRLIGYLENNGSIQNLQQTAFILGVTRPSLSRAIAQLVRQGMVRKEDMGYVLA